MIIKSPFWTNIHSDLVFLWPTGVIEAREEVTQLLLLLLLLPLPAGCGDVAGQRQQVGEGLPAERLGVAPPPGGRVAQTLVTHGGGAVDQQLAGGDQTLEEGVTQLGGEPLRRQVGEGGLRAERKVLVGGSVNVNASFNDLNSNFFPIICRYFLFQLVLRERIRGLP